MRRRFPLSHCGNTRDLGGYPVPGGGSTRYGVFFRSAVPYALEESDLAQLREAGLITVIDLRSSDELVKMKNVLAECADIDFYNLPMFDREAASGILRSEDSKSDRVDFCWGEHYVVMCAQHKIWVKAVFGCLARCRGAALFNCMTGKDRTGIIAALLLGCCGVSREDIIADYCVSQVYLASFYRLLEARAPLEGRAFSPNSPFFSTAPENMAMLLDYFDREFGGINGYLAACGVSEATLSVIRGKFLEKNDTKI